MFNNNSINNNTFIAQQETIYRTIRTEIFIDKKITNLCNKTQIMVANVFKLLSNMSQCLEKVLALLHITFTAELSIFVLSIVK